MERDALNAGVAFGGLVSTDEIRILICYILDSVKDAVPAQQLSELLHYEGIANYFEVSTAFASLEENGHIKKTDNDKYVITTSGSNIAATLKTSVPITVRDKTFALTVKLLSTMKYAEETRFDITECNNGYNVRCAVVEGETELIKVIHTVVSDIPTQHTVTNLIVFVADTLPLVRRKMAERWQVAAMLLTHCLQFL